MQNVQLVRLPNITFLKNKLRESATRALLFFEKKLELDGSYGREIKDISAFFKSPMLFIMAGKPELGIRSLSYIQNSFLLNNGDFGHSANFKSERQEYIEYWSYVNGWILRAANFLNKINKVSYDYFEKYYVGPSLGFLTNNITYNNGITDVLSAAHHGLLSLEMRNDKIAISAGDYLCAAIRKQPKSSFFYLRFDKNGKPITLFPPDKALFYRVNKTEPMQLYFMMGYPSAYLTLLYEKTKEDRYLHAAKAFLDFSLEGVGVLACNFSHKIAWAASILYSTTKEEKYFIAVKEIVNYFISTQSDTGVWYSDSDRYTQLDQSAEIACWFFDILLRLESLK